MPTLFIASRNPGKLHELRALLAHLSWTLLDPSMIGLEHEVQETGSDYAANARLKAVLGAQESGCWALADDTGLEVDVLNGAPGLHSARLAGPGRSDEERRLTLLTLLQPFPRPWTASFQCTVALASPQGETDLAEGICLGEIIPKPRGDLGFGYDPIFLVQDTGQTMAELPLDEKNQISHRARAVHALMPILKRRLESD
jgi:XTP/dITP diphosphohydrolase